MTLVIFSLSCFFLNFLGQKFRNDLKDIGASLTSVAFGSFSKEVYGTEYTKHMINYPLCQNPTTTSWDIFNILYNISGKKIWRCFCSFTSWIDINMLETIQVSNLKRMIETLQ